MKNLIILLALIGLLATGVAKPKPNSNSDIDLIEELKKLLGEKYTERNADDPSDDADIDGTNSVSTTEGDEGDEIEKKLEEGAEQEAEKEKEQEAEKEQQIEAELEEGEEEDEEEEAEQSKVTDESLDEDVEDEDEDEENGNMDDGNKPELTNMLHKGWDMLNELQRVSVALNLENNPIKDNKTPRAALQNTIVEMFEFDGLTEKVIRQLLHRLSPEPDVCSQMFSDGQERTLERITNCFIMRFTQLLSLVEHMGKASSASELKLEDLVRLTSLERDLFEVSYEIFRILKDENPSVTLPDIIGEKHAALVMMQEGNLKTSDSDADEEETDNPGDGPDSDEEIPDGPETNPDEVPDGPDEDSNPGGPGEEPGEDDEDSERLDEETGKEGEGREKGTDDESNITTKKDLLARLARKLEELLGDER